MGVEKYLTSMLRGKSAQEILQSMSQEDMLKMSSFVGQNSSMLPRRLRRKAERDLDRRTGKTRKK